MFYEVVSVFSQRIGALLLLVGGSLSWADFVDYGFVGFFQFV